MNDPDDLGIVDTSWLADADWAVINKLRRIHETEGQKAVRKALRALEPESYLRVAAAFFPDKVREAIKDEMAENGITEQDLREMAKKLHPSPTKHSPALTQAWPWIRRESRRAAAADLLSPRARCCLIGLLPSGMAPTS